MNTQEYQEYFEYLFELRESGRTNMFGAAAYLTKEKGLDTKKAKEILLYWMENFDDLAKELNIEI